MKANHNTSAWFQLTVTAGYELSKIQNESESQRYLYFGTCEYAGYELSKIQNESESQHWINSIDENLSWL